jgi:hypothetical protein
MDRLKDLKINGSFDIEFANEPVINIERSKFFNDIDKIESNIGIIDNIINKLIINNDEILIKEANKTIFITKNIILYYNSNEIANDRIKVNLINHITKLFLDITNKYQDIQIKIQKEKKR